MKNKLLSVILVGAMALSLVACGGASQTPAEAQAPAANDTAAASDAASEAPAAEASADVDAVTLTMWGAEEDQDLLRGLADEFIELHKDQVNLTVNIGVESESTAKDTVLADPEAAADVFAFADDQMKSLVDAGALQSIEDLNDALSVAGTSVDGIKAANSSGSINAATYNDTLYAFPMSGGNGFFLYYDGSKLSADDVSNWDSLLAAANANGQKVGMVLASGWYNASFFIGAGFSAGEVDAAGTTTIDWNGTSSTGVTGVEVTQAMLKIAGDPAFLAIADGDISNQIAAGGLIAVVSGTWDAQAAMDLYGDGYAATVLPKFTAGSKECQQGDYAGFKLVGVNPYSENTGWAVLLAEYITNESSQSARYTARQSLPTNTVAASIPEIQDNVALAAIMAQDAFGVPQTVGGNFWSPTATFGENVAQGTWSVEDTDAIQAALDELVDGVGAPVAE